jgi:peptidoglycan/LPS O-acetylase OafA/YrhL
MQGRRVFNSLDGLRGIAAIAVFTRHVPDRTIEGFLSGSYLAVDLFFVLSGFVLAHSYLSRLQGQMSIATFMRARFIRLYPLYILGTVVSIPLLFHSQVARALSTHDVAGLLKPLGCLAFSFAFLPAPPGLSPDLHPYPLNFPAWSLFFELVINLAFAVLAPRLTNRVLAVILVIGLVLLTITSIYFHGLAPGSLYSGFLCGGGRVVYSFFAGVAAYQLWRSGGVRWLALAPPVAATLMLVVFALEPAVATVYDLVAAALVFPVIVLAAARCEPRQYYVPLCKGLGRASYAIYILQIPILGWIEPLSKAFTHRDLISYGVFGSLFAIACVAGAALFLDRYFDMRARVALSAIAIQRPLTSRQ